MYFHGSWFDLDLCIFMVVNLTLTCVFLLPTTKLGQGNIFRSMCQQFCPQGGHAWLHRGACMVLFGGVCVVLFRGACMVLFGRACVVLFRGDAWFYLGGHAWFYSGGMHGFIWGGACVVLFGGHAWFYSGGVHGFIWGVHGFIRGACVVFSVFSDTMRYPQ